MSKDEANVGDLTSKWVEHTNKSKPREHLDYTKLNKLQAASKAAKGSRRVGSTVVSQHA